MSVSKNQRALVLVNSLSRYTTGIWKTVYQIGEWSGKTITMTALHDDYAHIYPCTGGYATRQRFLSKLKSATTKSGIKAVDVFFQTHGSPNAFHFYDGEVGAGALRNDIIALNLPRRLRLFYNLACYGDSQNSQEMLDAGFVTTIGSKRINCTSAVEFPIFCSMWQFDNKISDIMALADNPATRAAIDATVSSSSPHLSDANSKKVIRGKKNLRISSSVWASKSVFLGYDFGSSALPGVMSLGAQILLPTSPPSVFQNLGPVTWNGPGDTVTATSRWGTGLFCLFPPGGESCSDGKRSDATLGPSFSGVPITAQFFLWDPGAGRVYSSNALNMVAP